MLFSMRKKNFFAVSSAILTLSAVGFSLPAGASEYGQPTTPTTLPVPVPASAANVPKLPANSDNAAPGFLPIQPNYHGYYQYSVQPGQTTPTASITVANTTSTTQSYLIYPTYGITSSYTGLQYEQADPGGPATWMNMSPHVVTLAPKQTEVETFSVTVPQGVPAGDYVLAVVGQGPPNSAQEATTKKSTSAAMIVTSRTIVADVIQVQGATPDSTDMQVGTPTLSTQSNYRQVVTIPMRELGNRLVHPMLNLSITTCTNPTPVFKITNRQLDTFVPFTSINYPIFLNNTILNPGCYEVSGTLSNATITGKFHVTSKQANVNPAALLHPIQNQINQQNKKIALLLSVIGGIVAVVALAALALFLLGRRRRKGGIVTFTPDTSNGIEETRASIWAAFREEAKKYDVLTDTSATLVLKLKNNTIVVTTESVEDIYTVKAVCSDAKSFDSAEKVAAKYKVGDNAENKGKNKDDASPQVDGDTES